MGATFVFRRRVRIMIMRMAMGGVLRGMLMRQELRPILMAADLQCHTCHEDGYKYNKN